MRNLTTILAAGAIAAAAAIPISAAPAANAGPCIGPAADPCGDYGGHIAGGNPNECPPGVMPSGAAPCNLPLQGSNQACLQSGMCYQNPYTSPGS
jgi:uncharacterized membrane protein